MVFNLYALIFLGMLWKPLFTWAEGALPISPNPPAVSLLAMQTNASSQPFDIDEKGFYLLPERLLENTTASSTPRYLLKVDAPKRQLIIEFPFARLKNGLPSGYAVGMHNIEKVELLQHGGSLIDLARVVLTYKAGTNLSTLSLVSLSNGRLLIPSLVGGASNIVRSESRHGGGIIENTQSPPYANSPVPSNASGGSPQPAVNKSNESRTAIEVIEIDDQFFMLKPSLNSPPLKVKNEFYLENPNRFVLDLEPAVISPKLFSSEPDAKGAYPTSGVTQWQGWSVRVSQNTPNVVRLVIETEEARNFTVLQGKDNAFKNSVIIQPSQAKNPFWDKVKITQPKVMSALKQLYISNESPNTPIKFRLESQRPIQYKVVKESPTRFSVDLLNVTAPPEPMGFDVSHFPYLKSLSHVQSAQGSRLLVELNKPFDDLRSTPFTSLNALELSFNLVTSAPVVIQPNSPNNPNRPPNNGRKVIVIDAGHGGKDAGAMRDGIMEKHLNLSVALKLRNELQARGYVVYMTRSNDTFLSLKQITQVAASYNPHIFISVHHNSSNSAAIYGLETYYYHGFSLTLAQAVHAKQVQSLAVVDRGVRKNQFYVINHTSVPSILCELGYVSNPNELKVLNTEIRQRQQAKAIADGVDAYFKRNGR
jgi:N-acetylmuramoyl-L-alanine amidase